MNSLRYIIVVVVLVVAFSSCKKDDGDPNLAFKDLKVTEVRNTGAVFYAQKGNYVLSVCDSLIRVKNMTNPFAPYPCEGNGVARVPLYDMFKYSFDGDTLINWYSDPYGTNQDPYYYILDISNPLDIKYLFRIRKTNELISGWYNGYLFMTEVDMIRIYDMQNIEKQSTIGDLTPYKKGEIKLANLWYAQHSWFSGHIGYFGGNSIFIINFANVNAPTFEGMVVTQSNNGFLYHNNTVFALGNNEITALNVSEPTRPKALSRIRILYNSYNIYTAAGIHNGYLYVGGEGGLKVFNISDPKDMQLVKFVATEPEEISTINFLGNYIVSFSLNRTWATPYQNTVYFSNNIP